jgi:hypothetical protein
VSTILATPSLPTSSSRIATRSPTILSAGIVAHNEERNLEGAVRSLLDQDLPSGVWWNTLWIVASGCTDRTVDVAEQLAGEDGRIRVAVEPKRLGKAHALREVFRQAQGNVLVLLNADARAEPGAVAELVRVGASHPPPFAVMGRPVVPDGTQGRWTKPLRLMWELHHTFHLELQRVGGGAHLSDELLLLSLPQLPPLPDGIINDGSYVGVWLSQNGGRLLYAPEARVSIQVPQRVRDHLHQRRRIQFGNQQVTAALGAPPSTLTRYALRSPEKVLDLLRHSMRTEDRGLVRLAWLGAAEAAARVLATWDRLPPRKDHVRWQRIAPALTRAAAPRTYGGRGTTACTPVEERLELRVNALLETARRFETGLELANLVDLLPTDGPATLEGIRRWFGARPGIGRVEGDVVFPPHGRPSSQEARRARGIAYRKLAKEVVERRLGRCLPLVRCLGITGSTAYGEPEVGDDIDFLVVTRTGAMWVFLAHTYLTLRFRRKTTKEPELCFNFVLDDLEAPREFARGRGFLFAREALTAGILQGEEYYRHLLASAPWMVEELPRLFDSRASSESPRPLRPLPSPLRYLNAFLFPFLATYLQLVGLRRNHRLRRLGRGEAIFRTETGLHRLAFVSRRFEELRHLHPEARAGAADTSEPVTSSHPTPR